MDPYERDESTRVDHEIDDLAVALAANLGHETNASELSSAEQEQELGDILRGLLQHTKPHTP